MSERKGIEDLNRFLMDTLIKKNINTADAEYVKWIPMPGCHADFNVSDAEEAEAFGLNKELHNAVIII